MNTNFKEWLELQESLPANLAMMLGSILPSSGGMQKQIAPSVEMQPNKQEQSVEAYVRSMRKKIQNIKKDIAPFKVALMSNLNNNLIHPANAFTKIIIDDPKQLKFITNIESLEARLDQLEMLMDTFNEKLDSVEKALINSDKLPAHINQDLGRAVMLMINLVESLKDIIDDYDMNITDAKKQKESDFDAIMKLDDLAANNLELSNMVLKTLDKLDVK